MNENEIPLQVNDLKEAIEAVSGDYAYYLSLGARVPKELEERVFAYELYHQWSIIIEKKEENIQM